MNKKKKRIKDRRRATKLADQAWVAAGEENFDLALKIIRRAIEAGIGNPLHWYDQGLLFEMNGDDEGAAHSFEATLSLAPDFADACAGLASIRLRQGKARDAVALQKQAVKHDPASESYRERLNTYSALVGIEQEAPTEAVSAPLPESGERIRQVETLDWNRLESELTKNGCALIPSLLSREECGELVNLYPRDDLFAKTVVMNKKQFGQGEYRYFSSPIPLMVHQLRQALYRPLARVAQNWQRLLGRTWNYPDAWEGMKERCEEKGQSTSTPLLLKYKAGGFNAPHRDVRGEVFFPIQLAVVLSPKGEDGFTGGEFVLSDDPEDRKSARIIIPAGLGDGILFTTRERMVPIGGSYGRQSVKHGVNVITSGTRFVLGLPFHEFA